MLLKLAALVCVVSCVRAAATPPMTEIKGSMLDTLRTQFRTSLLDKISLEVEAMTEQTVVLEGKMNDCKLLVNNTVDECKTCATAACQSSPGSDLSALDYIKIGINAINPVNYLKEPIDHLASGVTKVVNLIGNKAKPFLNSIKNVGAAVGSTVSKQFETAFEKMNTAINGLGKNFLSAGNFVVDKAKIVGNTFDNLGGKISTGFENLGGHISSGVSDIGKGLENVGKTIGDAIGGIFTGRRRRSVDAQTRACMEQCPVCTPLLADTDEAIVTGVCGSEISTLNNTIQARAAKVQRVYDAVIDEVNTILSKVEYDPTSLDPGVMQFTRVQLTVFLNGQYTTYMSAHAYKVMDIHDSAIDWAMEYWAKAQ